MRFAYRKQKFQDWFTQQWAILWGRKIDPSEFPWLIGPFGKLGTIGDEFVYQLAKEENLTVERNVYCGGLIPSIKALNLSVKDLTTISKEVIDFYENTANYQLDFKVQWNPFFKLGGNIISKLFSERIKQLNIPKKNLEGAEEITSEIIHLKNHNNNEVRYTVWYRTFKNTGEVLYSGIYGTCTIPSGKICIKAVFPLPNGNATVIMEPSITENGSLILNSTGKKFGDAGFYFLLNDEKGDMYADFKSSFQDKLTISTNNGKISAIQQLTLWNRRILEFNYNIIKN